MHEIGIHRAIQATYAAAARSSDRCVSEKSLADELYETADLISLPEAAITASLGCANPVALADLRPGETVLDLGSGAGADALLSARRVRPGGFVYGLDMTPEMIALAEENRQRARAENVRFLHGRIEQIPLPDESVDVIVSNCVVNLSPDKRAAFAEAHRVLRPGGRLAIADLATRGGLPTAITDSLAAWAGCLAGALDVEDLREMVAAVGFVDGDVAVIRSFGPADLDLLEQTPLGGFSVEDLSPEDIAATDGRLVSVFVRGRKAP